MRKRTGKLILAMLGFALIVLAAVKTDYSHSADFSRYKTYSWIKVQTEDPLWQDRITQAVDSQLTAKGWTKVPADGDASIAGLGATRTRRSLQTWYTGLGGGWYWSGFGDGMATTTEQDIPVGTLLVDIFDTPTKKLIWRGNASETLSGKPEKDEKKLDKAVAEMFKNFPPRSKG